MNQVDNAKRGFVPVTGSTAWYLSQTPAGDVYTAALPLLDAAEAHSVREKRHLPSGKLWHQKPAAQQGN